MRIRLKDFEGHIRAAQRPHTFSSDKCTISGRRRSIQVRGSRTGWLLFEDERIGQVEVPNFDSS